MLHGYFFQYVVEPCIGIHYTAFHSRLDHAVAVGDRLKDRLNGKAGPVAGQIFKAGGLQHHVAFFGQAFKLEGLDDPLRRGVLMAYTMECKFHRAAWNRVDEAIRTAGIGLKFFVADGHVIGPGGPLCQQIFLAECAENDLARRIEFADDESSCLP